MDVARLEIVQNNQIQTWSEVDDFTAERYAQFLRHFPATVTDVLDIGCNTGRGGGVLKTSLPNIRLTGQDCVPDRLESLSPTYDRTLVGFADHVEAPNRSFDVVVAGEVVEHIPGGHVMPSLHEMFRILRLKGRVLLTTPNPHYLRNKLFGKSVLEDPSHVSQHTPAGLKRKLEEASFSNVRVYGSGRLTRSLGQYFPLLSVYGSYLIVGEKW